MPRPDPPGHPYLDWPVPLAIAHRGGARLEGNIGLENSLAAFQRAVELGYAYLETDVHASRDGTVFAFHDVSLDRVTDGTGLVRERTAEQVRAAKIDGREPIPELSTLFEMFPGARFNIDIKSDDALDPTLAVVRQHAAYDRVCIASFSDLRLRQVREREPRVATSLSPGEAARLRLAPWRSAWSVGARRGALCAQVPLTRSGVRVVTAGFVRRAHACGLQVHVWTIDDEETMIALLDLGVDGIVTDRPDTLRDVLRRRNEWVTE